MPFTAVCLHCKKSKYRVPFKKRGTFAHCPKCRRDFLLVPEARGFAPPVDYRPPPFDAEPASAPTVAEYAAATPTLPAPEAAPPLRPVTVDDPAPPPDPPNYALRVALAALGAVGVAAVVSQFPYGRFVAAPLAAVGAVVAALSLFGLDRLRWVGWAGAGLNAAVFLLVVALPSWLGLSGWTPAADPEAGPRPVTAVGRDGGLPRPADWVDAGRAVWEQGDVRVAVTAVTVGPLHPAAKDPARRKERGLWVEVKLTNVGVARAIQFDGWAPAPPDDPTLTTATGKPLPARPMAASAKTAVLPGKSAECVLAFATPAAGDDLRLELPARAFGGTEPVRFLIPRAIVSGR